MTDTPFLLSTQSSMGWGLTLAHFPSKWSKGVSRDSQCPDVKPSLPHCVGEAHLLGSKANYTYGDGPLVLGVQT